MEVKPKRGKKILLTILAVFFVIALAAGTFFVIDNFLFDTNDSVTPSEKTQNPELNLFPDENTDNSEWIVAPDMPRFMSIPAIGLNNVRVEELGVKAGTEKQFDDPKNSSNAGWYSESVKPGNGSGTGLYDGHYMWYSQVGVFYRLSQLAYGNTITIERGDGQKFTYTVMENETVPYTEVDMTKMMQSFDPSLEGISLITCGGTWDEESGLYTHRTTIRAVIQ